jgi:hypothetical protein
MLNLAFSSWGKRKVRNRVSLKDLAESFEVIFQTG